MGKGHGNDGKPFDIETACYLKPVFAGIERDSTRKVVIKAGVKTLKTFTVEAAAGYYVPHGIGDATMYFGTGEAADDHATTRLLAYLKSIPSFAEKMQTIVNRFNDTQSALKFPDKTFRICPANLTWTQNVNLCFAGICDAFLTKGTGMIDQVWARTTQYPNDKKFIVESQGGEDGDDFDRHYWDTDQGELHVKCPCCGCGHIWNWKAWDMTRKDDFAATPPLSIPSLDHAAWVSHHTPILKSEERKHCGFRRGDESKVRLPDGTYNEQEITRSTYFECYHCGGEWHDDGRFGATRIGLDQSSYYVPSRATALHGHLGFNFPQWINRRLPWGAMMLQKLNAQKEKKERGNSEPLKIWWQKVAGRSWNSNLQDDSRMEILSGGYDPNSDWPDEKWKVILVDCQEELTFFWFSIHGVAKDGRTRQLHRGSCGNFGDIVALQKKWNVPDQRVFLDAGHKQERLVEECAAHGHASARTGRWICWQLFKGSGLPDFPHERRERGQVVERYRHPISNPKIFYVRRGNVSVAVNLFNFSNLLVSDMAQRYRDGEKSPECKFLDRLPNEPDDDSELSWKKQLRSEHKETVRNPRSNLMEERWMLNKQHLPNHGWDLLKMLCAFLLKTGIAQSVMECENKTP
jgi:hypothetical protein